MRKTLATVVFASLFAVPVAFAQSADFGTIDANADGGLSMDEVKAANANIAEDVYNAADANGDGALSPDEFDAASASLLAQ